MGNHVLVCGDARESADIEHLLEGAEVSLCWTDPDVRLLRGDRAELMFAPGVTVPP